MTDPLNARAAGAAPGADRPPEILSQIVERRRGRLRVEGYALGCHVPRIRVAPLVPFGGDPFLITEIKRRSPSKGWIARDLSAASHAALYRREGSINISVLTEEDHFAGSLDDLMAVKMTVPDAAVLRKDFLLDEEDVEVSYRAGADAVLLIARILSAAELEKLYAKARRLGMEALVEVYDEEDVRKAARVRPSLTGINSRNLARFTTDLVHWCSSPGSAAARRRRTRCPRVFREYWQGRPSCATAG
jgi:indole-3-glycerol phosphate synthase/phosphoribosylanthranilate isomerase